MESMESESVNTTQRATVLLKKLIDRADALTDMDWSDSDDASARRASMRMLIVLSYGSYTILASRRV